MESQGAVVSDSSSAQEPDLEDDNDSDSDNEPTTAVTLHPDIGHTVNASFDCPLKSLSRYTIAAAQKSARLGCPNCILRTATIADIFPSSSKAEEIEGSHGYLFLPFYMRDQRIVLASNEEPHEDEEPIVCEFYGDKIGGIECVERVVPCDTNSKESLETVKKWLKICEEEHDCTSNAVAELPRRMLDVRNDTVRLHETSVEDYGSKYACLSHCWGNPPETMLRSTPATFNTYLEAIPWEMLPPTFQDAVSFARKLDIAFLWIDALCIIQGDAKDWQEQSSIMANIYRGAHITLAATSSHNADGGCYTRSKEPPVHRVTSPLAIVKHPSGTEQELFARMKFKHNMKNLPLLGRGWVYQERILSPRVLHFMNEELVWECSHAVTCECGGDNLEYAMERARISESNSFSLIGDHIRHPQPLDLWYQLVDEYTALSLTHRNDIFPALSGIVKAFAAKIQDEYIAGMWKRTLLSNLLWYPQVTEEASESKEQEAPQNAKNPWRAPSWSWASNDWLSEFRVLPTTKELAEVRNTSCQPSGADPTGELSFANLTLRTKLIPARFDCSSGTIHLDGLVISTALPRISSYILSELYTCYFDLKNEYLENQPNILLAQIAECTGDSQVYLYAVHENMHFKQEVRSFMLLAKRDNENENENEGWLRVGLATIAIYEPEMTLFTGRKREERQDVVKGMTRGEIRKALEDRADLNRELFRRWDEIKLQDVVVW
jgi:hypothetical protein